MKKQGLILACLLCATMAVQAAGNLPQGKWTVTQVTIAKSIDGNLQTTVYNSPAEVKGYIPCMMEWEVNGSNITLRYPNGRKESASYTLDGNNLTIKTATASRKYQYSISGNTITLTAMHNYRNNLSGGQVQQIKENWTLILTN